MKHSKKIFAGIIALGAVIGLTGCTTDADQASRNISTAAEQFEVNRRITVMGVNGEVTLQVEGRCSVESGDSLLAGALEIMCKIGPNEFVKHFAMQGDNGTMAVQQLDTIDVSVYHHRVLIKPENLLPEFDYEGGEQ